jgi:WD40 repeat protein
MYLATIERDQSVRVWDATNGTLLNYLSPKYQVRAIAFDSADPQLAMMGDQQAFIWQYDTGKLQSQFSHHTEVHNAIFSSDGKCLVTMGKAMSKDDCVSVWIWQLDDLLLAASQRLPRNLSRDEWKQYFGDEPYRQTFSLETWRSHWRSEHQD